MINSQNIFKHPLYNSLSDIISEYLFAFFTLTLRISLRKAVRVEMETPRELWNKNIKIFIAKPWKVQHLNDRAQILSSNYLIST